MTQNFDQSKSIRRIPVLAKDLSAAIPEARRRLDRQQFISGEAENAAAKETLLKPQSMPRPLQAKRVGVETPVA
ncbi:MAG: hypothetical protein JO136_17020 [Hyphomicrobiales bacterium]|nr:hypothetical protein [Hyphomicrobiales bacterium]